MNDIVDDHDITLNIIETKHGAHRRVDLWKAPAQFIRRYFLLRLGHGAKGGDSFLISYNHGKPKLRRLTHSSLDALIKAAAKSAGIRRPEVRLHMFRATHANDLQSVKGYTLPAVMERMGWRDLSTAGRYLVHRERIHRVYNSLHEYWIDFPRLYKEASDADNDGGVVG